MASSSAWVLPYNHWSLGDDIPQDLEILEDMEDREHHHLQMLKIMEDGEDHDLPSYLIQTEDGFFASGGGSQFSEASACPR